MSLPDRTAEEVAKMNLKDTQSTNQQKDGLAPFAAKLPRNTKGTAVQVDTNIRRITLKPNTPIFKYDIQIDLVFKKLDGTERRLTISKSPKNSPNHAKEIKWCLRVYQQAIAALPELKTGGPFFYDRQASLYGLSKINKDLKFETAKDVTKSAGFVKAEFKLTKVAETFQASTNDVAVTVSSKPAEKNVTLLEALNTIVSSAAYENSNVVTMGACVHYILDTSETNVKDNQPDNNFKVQNGKTENRFYGVGAFKAVKTIEGASGAKAQLALTTELKRSMFHFEKESLISYFKRIQGFSPNLNSNTKAAIDMITAVKGINCYLSYGQNRKEHDEGTTIKIAGIADVASRQSFTYEGEQITVAQYFLKKNKIKLDYPNFFTISAKGKGGKLSYFPPEVLMICPNQIVRTEQMISDEQAGLIRIAACSAAERRDQTLKVSNAVGIGKSTGGILKVADDTEKVNGIILAPPATQYGGRNNEQYFRPASLTNWQVVFQAGKECRPAVDALIRQMQSFGMKVNAPVISTVKTSRDLRPTFQSAQGAKRQLLFFITPCICNYHQEIKALEQEFDVLTQDLRLKTAEKVQHQGKTRENIVAKTNIKLGGLNYDIKSSAFSTGNNLFIGLETSSRGGDGIPVTVGYSANTMAQPAQFSGSYKFVEKNPNVFGSVIIDIVVECIAAFQENRKTKPLNIFVYVNGLSEGQYYLINETYTAQVKAACEKFNDKNGTLYRPHLTLLAATKNHNERLFLKTPKGIDNVVAGTVVDHGIVNPALSEWYHAGAKAIKGTAKPAKYTVIFTTNRALTMEILETLTNDLCHAHQIVTSPVSLPAPLYIAGLCGERGSAILAFNRPVLNREGQVDYAETNKKLSYDGKKLRATRFNA